MQIHLFLDTMRNQNPSNNPNILLNYVLLFEAHRDLSPITKKFCLVRHLLKCLRSLMAFKIRVIWLHTACIYTLTSQLFYIKSANMQ